MKILVTGANGFVGSNLCDELLQSKFSVVALVRRTSNLKYIRNKPLEIRYGEITKKDTLKGLFKDIDVVVHAAATVEIDDIPGAFMINGKATGYVVERAMEEGVKKFIYISSQAALGPSRGVKFKKEEETEPVSVYGKSKLYGEKELLRHRGSIKLVILRPPAIFGPRDRESFVLFHFLKMGFIPLTGNREKYFPFIYIKDFVKIIKFFITWEENKEVIFNVSDGKVYPYSQILRFIARLMDIRVHRYPVPLPETLLYNLLPFIRHYIPPIINRDKFREFYHPYWFMSSSRLRRLHNFKFTPVKKALEETIEWYRREGWL